MNHQNEMIPQEQEETRRLSTNVQYIYAALRSAMVDRDRDTDDEYNTHVIIQIAETGFALKANVPSSPLLLSYMILYYPGLLERAAADQQTQEKNWFAYAKILAGGEANTKMPIFSNDMMIGTALAIGVYVGFVKCGRHHITGDLIFRPNFDNPMVRRTHELIRENNLTILDARDVFIELMQDEEYRITQVADDYIANTSWIIENEVNRLGEEG